MYGVGLPELFESIRSVGAGGVALSPVVAARITNRVKGETLTEREECLLEQMRLGLSNKAIKLWDALRGQVRKPRVKRQGVRR